MPKLDCKSCLAAGLSAVVLPALVTLTLAATLSVAAVAQGIPAPPAPPVTSSTGPTSNTNSVPRTSSTDEAAQDQSVETLKVSVEVVQLFFNVKDKHGALIPNLNKDNFELFEDGQPQTIKYFKAESDLPLTLGILIDSSGSQMRVLDMEKRSRASFSRTHCAPRTRPSSSASTSISTCCRISPVRKQAQARAQRGQHQQRGSHCSGVR